MAPKRGAPIAKRTAMGWASIGALGLCGAASSFVLEQGLGLTRTGMVPVNGFVSSRGIMVPSLGRQHLERRLDKATANRPLTMVTSVKVNSGICMHICFGIFCRNLNEASGCYFGSLRPFMEASPTLLGLSIAV